MICPGNSRECTSLARYEQGRGIEQDELRRATRAELYRDLTHAGAGEQLGAVFDELAGGEDFKPAHIGMLNQRIDIQGVVRQRIQQSRLAANAEDLTNSRFGCVGVNQKH